MLRVAKSATGRLAATYLGIIMLMSIGFSVMFYNTSSHQLGRQLPPDSYFNTSPDGLPGGFGSRRQNVNEFLQARIDEGRSALLIRLVWLNILALIGGGVVSYYLARRTLEPIEEAMDAQTRFVSDASHELRTPITALQATNEVALRKPKLSIAEAKDLLQYNVEEAVKLKLLSDGLLGLLKQEHDAPQTTTVSLQDIIGEAMNRVVQYAVKKGITINDEVPNVEVLGNKQTLAQVVTILLDNAVKYSHPKGTIYLEGNTKGKYAYLNVRDEGVGIKASDIPHIFERFYRADSSRSKENKEGYGLGLSIAHKIIEQHNGEISVQSTIEHGSTFILKLPLAPTARS